MDVRVRLSRKLSTEELMLLNCGVGKDSWESLGLQGDPTSPFWRRSALGSLEGMMLKLKLQYFGHLMWRWLIGKDSDAGRDWEQEEKGMTEDEMAGWHHWLDGRESGWTLRVGDGQGGWHAAIHGVAKSRTWLSHWPELNWIDGYIYSYSLLYLKNILRNWPLPAKILVLGFHYSFLQLHQPL